MNTSPNDLENLKIGESHLTEVSHGLETIFIRETTDNFLLKIVTYDTKKEVARQRVSITNRDPYKLSAQLESLDDNFWQIKLNGKNVSHADIQGNFPDANMNFNYEKRTFEITTKD